MSATVPSYVTILAELASSRAALLEFMGDRYVAHITPWADGLERIMVAKKCTAIEAMNLALVTAKEQGADYGPTAITLQAACLEVYRRAPAADRTDSERFSDHLRLASAEVATWPQWKRDALGRLP